MRHTCDLTDEQWKVVDSLLPEPTRQHDGRGQPWKSLLWVLRPVHHGPTFPTDTPHFRLATGVFNRGCALGVPTRIMTALPNELAARGGIDVREAFIDASFAPAKRGLKVGQTKRANGTRIMAVADRHGLPVLVCVESATPHEVDASHFPLLQMVVPDAPQNVIGDNAYDSDHLDAELIRALENHSVFCPP